MGFLLLGMVNTGRCRVYAPDGSEDARAFWREVELGRYAMRAHDQMRWGVPETEGHDDYLVSLALCCRAAELASAPAADSVVRARP